MRTIALLTVLAGPAWAGLAAAQPAAGDRPAQAAPPPPAQTQPDPACPPDARTNTPSTSGSNAPDLSDRLANSNGVICPPAGVDPQMHVPPPAEGEMKIIPPPGSPGGNPNVQPK
jgi:hypothetical protein